MAAFGGQSPLLLRRTHADDDEYTVDWDWLVQLARLLEEQPLVDLDAVLESIDCLYSLLLAEHAIGVNRSMRNELEGQRRQWNHSGFFRDSGVPDALVDQVMLIYANTLQEPPIFKHVAEVMRDQHRTSTSGPSRKVRAALPYLKALDSGLQALALLPGFRHSGDTYRGMKYRYHNLEERFKVGQEVHWYEPRSATRDPNLMLYDDFCGTAGDRTIFILSGVEGALISKLSKFPSEEEVLMRPLVRFRVSKVVRQSGEPGDPFDTADLVYMEMLPESCPSCSLADTLVMGANDTCAKAGLEVEQQLPSERVRRGHGPRMVIVGPQNSGKSTFANALFGRVLVPSGKLPNTLLPAVFLPDSDLPDYSVELHGEGLREALQDTLLNTKLESLSRGEAAVALDSLNKACRDLVERGSVEETHLYDCGEWSLLVHMPGPRAGCAVVDCPGGSEIGATGAFIRRVLRFQVANAVAVAFVVAADNIETLKNRDCVLDCLGGPMIADAARHSFVIVSKTTATDIPGHSKFVHSREVRENVDKVLAGAKVFFASGQSILAWSLIQRRWPLPSWPIMDPSIEDDIRFAFAATHPKQEFNQKKYDRFSEYMYEDVSELFKSLPDNATAPDALHRALAGWPLHLAASCLQKQLQDVELALQQNLLNVHRAQIPENQLKQRLLRCKQALLCLHGEFKLVVARAARPQLEFLEKKRNDIQSKLQCFDGSQATWDMIHNFLRDQCGDFVAWSFRHTVGADGLYRHMRTLATTRLFEGSLICWSKDEMKKYVGLALQDAQRAAFEWVNQRMALGKRMETLEWAGLPLPVDLPDTSLARLVAEDVVDRFLHHVPRAALFSCHASCRPDGREHSRTDGMQYPPEIPEQRGSDPLRATSLAGWAVEEADEEADGPRKCFFSKFSVEEHVLWIVDSVHCGTLAVLDQEQIHLLEALKGIDTVRVQELKERVDSTKLVLQNIRSLIAVAAGCTE